MKNIMTLNEILSIGYDTLDDKYVRMCVRMLCTYYYINDISRITHKMINSKNILPLYKAMIKYIHIKLIYHKRDIQLLSLLCYCIFKSRFKNRECSLYRKITDDGYDIIRVNSGNIYIYFQYYSKEEKSPWMKICKPSQFEEPFYDFEISPDVIKPGSDIKKIFVVNDVIDMEYMDVLLYKTNRLYETIMPEILCVDERPSTHFSGIPSMYV